MKSLYAAALAVLVLACPNPLGASTNTVVDVPTRGFSVRILHLRPDAARANVVLLSGGSNALGIQNDGTMTSPVATCNPATRNRQALADHGYAVAVVDISTDFDIFRYEDLIEVIRYLQAHDKVPTWLLGGSTATEASVALLARSPLGNGIGAVLYSPEFFDASQAAQVKAPSRLVYHPLDARNRATVLATAMTAAPVVELVALTGGTTSPCAGYHTLTGLNAPFLDAVFGFIDQYNPTLAYVAVDGTGVARAVEFYNASLDHYFVSHIASEIALLDAGVAIKGWVRTNESFNVYTSAQGATSPVCRFYIPPGKGDSHFYGRGTTECNSTAAKNPTFVNEDPQFFHVLLPVLGVCPAGTRNVYRVFSNRPDANHRYMVDSTLRNQMTAKGWLAEGDGPDLVVMCSPL